MTDNQKQKIAEGLVSRYLKRRLEPVAETGTVKRSRIPSTIDDVDAHSVHHLSNMKGPQDTLQPRSSTLALSQGVPKLDELPDLAGSQVTSPPTSDASLMPDMDAVFSAFLRSPSPCGSDEAGDRSKKGDDSGDKPVTISDPPTVDSIDTLLHADENSPLIATDLALTKAANAPVKLRLLEPTDKPPRKGPILRLSQPKQPGSQNQPRIRLKLLKNGSKQPGSHPKQRASLKSRHRK